MSFLKNLLTAAAVYVTGGAYAVYLAAAAFVLGTYGDMEARRQARNARRAFNDAQRDRMQMVRSATEPRTVVYGRMRASGPIAFMQATGSKSEYLHLVVLLAGHEIDAVETVYFNDVALPAPNSAGLILSGAFCPSHKQQRFTNVATTAGAAFSITLPLAAGETLDSITAVWTSTYDANLDLQSTLQTYTLAGNVVSGTSGGLGVGVDYVVAIGDARVRIRTALGAPFQAAYSELVSESGGKWTTADTITGLPSVYARLQFDSDIFGQTGLPNISAVVRGAKVRDPRSNLVLQSQTLDDAAWSKSNCTVTANATTAPDGTNTGDKIAESVTTSVVHSVAPPSAGAFAAGQTVTLSCWVKAAERTAVMVRLLPSVALATTGYATVDLTSGAVLLSSGLTGTPDVRDYGSGWYRVVITVTATGAGAMTPTVMPCVGTNNTYAGAVGSGLYCWGMALNPGPLASGYVPTTTAAVAAGTRWSENAALCTADYLRRAFGATDAELADDELGEAAWICDQPVQINAGGSTQARYTVGGVLSTKDTPRNNLEQLLECMAGSAVYVQGRWLLRAGAWRAPVKAITESMLAGDGVEIQMAAPRTDLYNRVQVKYPEPGRLYAMIEAAPVTSSAYLAADGGVDLPTQLDLEMCTDSLRAQRLGQIALARMRQGVMINLTCNLRGYDLLPSDVVTFPVARYGFGSTQFEVTRREYSPEDQQIKLSLRKTAASVWTWSYTGATPVDTTPLTTLPNPLAMPPTLTGLAAISGTAQMLRMGDGTVVTRALVSWTQAADVWVQQGGRIELQWRQAQGSVWQDEPRLPGTAISSYIGPLADLGIIIIRARAVNVRDRASDWVSIAHLVVGKSALPATVSGLTAGIVQGGVQLAWYANGETDYAYTELRRGTSWASGTALDGSAVSTRPTRVTGTYFNWVWPALGSYTVWAAHVDTSGNVSAAIAGLSVTVDNSVSVQWSALNGRPDMAGNLIRKSTFEDGSAGSWSAPAFVAAHTGTTWGKHLTVTARDTVETNSEFPVIVGDTLYVAADIGGNTDYTTSLGLMVLDSSGAVLNWIAGVTAPAVAGWARYTGTAVMPAGSVRAIPWIQINGPGGTTLMEHWYANLYIGKAVGTQQLVPGAATDVLRTFIAGPVQLNPTGSI